MKKCHKLLKNKICFRCEKCGSNATCSSCIKNSLKMCIYLKPKVVCHCDDVKMGSYDNQTILLRERKRIAIDTCILTAIGFLWHKGVNTLGSCCGHGKLKPTVVVDKKSAKIMEAMDYKLDPSKKNKASQVFLI